MAHISVATGSATDGDEDNYDAVESGYDFAKVNPF